MRRAFRAARAAPANALCLGCASAGVVAGAACVAAFPTGGEGRSVTFAVLVGIGLAACLATAAIVVGALRARAGEIDLVSVRGFGRGRMWRWLVAEPMVVIAAGSVAGLALAAVTIELLVAAGRARPDSLAAVASTGIGAAVVCVVTAAVGCRLAEAVAEPSTRRSPSMLRASFECIVLVGAGWLLVTAAAAGRGESTALVSLAPLAAVLAAVIASAWLVRGVGAIAMMIGARTTNPSRYLAVRRLRRTNAVAFACVAGVVVMAVFGLTARDAEAQWRDEVTMITTGGVDAYDSDLSATATFLATRAADPDGRWLMTAEAVATDTEADEYRGFADLTRWDRVVGESWRDSAGDDIAAAYRHDDWSPVLIRSGALSVAFDATMRWPHGDRAYLNLSLLRPDGEIVTAGVPLSARGDDVRGQVRGCPDGCVLRKLTFGTQADAPVDLTGRIVLREISVDGEPVTIEGEGRTWSPDLATAAADGGPVEARMTPSGLRIDFAARGLSDPAGVVPSSEHLTRRIVAAGPTRIHEGVLGLDPTTAPGEVVARAPSLPLLGTHGYLGDLADVVLDSYDEPTGARVRVLARSDTPGKVLSELDRRGVDTGHVTTPDAVGDDLADSDLGRGALAWCVLAAVVGIAAAAVAVHSESVRRSSARRDVAGLRSAHVPPGVIARSARYEIGALSVTTTATGVVIALVTWWCTHSALLLAEPGPFEPAVDTSMRAGVVVLVAGPVVLLAAGAALLVRRRDRVTARPETLRRSDER